MSHPPIVWIAFLAFVFLMLAIDLGVFHRRSHRVGLRESLAWTGVWITLALLFNLSLYLWPEVYGIPVADRGARALEFLAGYLIEKSLSLDNIFVFWVIFRFYRIPDEHQHQVLLWGILGALVMRAIFIAAGITLLQYFDWMIFVFGALLVWTGMRMVGGHHESAHPDQNPLIRYVARHVPVARGATGGAFFVREHGKLFITPLLMALITIELSDLMFAIDSIPAVLSITRDPFIVFTSNVFAILGLRALYFALADLVTRLRHLASTIAAILIFVGVKMIVEPWLHIPIGVSLGIIGGAMTLGTVASLLHPLPPKAAEDQSPGARSESTKS